MYHLTFDPDAGEPGDKLWGLPRDVSTFALYINNDLIAEAGADDPRRWQRPASGTGRRSPRSPRR